jgi:hypothetical protein
MSQKILSSSVGVAIYFFTAFNGLIAAPIVEKSGRFEINWSSGMITFYGQSTLEPSDEAWRSAEQRAWTDGVTYLETDAPKALAAKWGADAPAEAKLGNSLKLTRSLYTSYFGDKKIKVILEAKLSEVMRGLTPPASAGTTLPANASGAVLIKLSSGSQPSPVFSIVSESGAVLLPAENIKKTIIDGATISRWFKGQATAPEGTPTLSATVKAPGVFQVASADWKDEYASAIANGKAFVVNP